MLKVRLEPFLAMSLITACGGVLGAPALLWTGLPGVESAWWLLASVILHFAYYFTLTEAYRRADMGVIYPIARGSAPLLTGLFSVLILGEPLRLLGAAGIAVLGFGIFVMSMRSAKETAHIDRKALFYAGLTAVTICAYTLTDGAGARASGNPAGYAAALFVGDAILLVPATYWLRGREGFRQMKGFVWQGMAGAAMSCGAYTIAIWAMSVAPIPLVAAVRETSVLFGAAIAVVILKEPLRLNRVAAAFLIVCGLALIRLQ